MRAKFMACLDNNFMDTLMHLTMHNSVTVFYCPDDVKLVMKFGMAFYRRDYNPLR